MSKSPVIEKLGSTQLKKEITPFRVGDTIRVHIRISEGEKERIQIFTGTVIARKGTGLSETFSLHRFAYGEGMERVFLLHSPRIAKIELVKKGRVRRSKLYYLRGTSGKASKVKGHLGPKGGYGKKGVNNNEQVVEEEITEISTSSQEAVGEPTSST